MGILASIAAREGAVSEPFTRVSYPGELGVPPVRVAYDVPAGWQTDPIPGALGVSREPTAGPEGFWANIVTSIDRVAPSETLDHVITHLLVSAREGATELVVCGERVLDVAGTPAVLREQVLRVTTSAAPLAQFVLALLVDVGDGVARDCVQITGTVEEARRDEFASTFSHLAASVTIDV